MPPPKPERRTDKTPKGLKIPVRKRSAVLKDFKKIAGPLRGANRDPEAET